MKAKFLQNGSKCLRLYIQDVLSMRRVLDIALTPGDTEINNSFYP